MGKNMVRRPLYRFEVEYLDVYNGESSISGYYGRAQTPFEAWDRILTYLRGSVDGYVLHTIIERVDESEEINGGTTKPSPASIYDDPTGRYSCFGSD